MNAAMAMAEASHLRVFPQIEHLVERAALYCMLDAANKFDFSLRVAYLASLGGSPKAAESKQNLVSSLNCWFVAISLAILSRIERPVRIGRGCAGVIAYECDSAASASVAGSTLSLPLLTTPCTLSGLPPVSAAAHLYTDVARTAFKRMMVADEFRYGCFRSLGGFRADRCTRR